MRRAPTTIADCTGGEVVRVSAGVYRIVGGALGLPWQGRRRAYLMVGNPPAESRAPCMLELRTPILELLEVHAATEARPADEVDPLLRSR